MSKRKAAASHSSQGHYHGPITRGTITDNLSCCRCSSSIDIVADHVVLSPCHCCVCPECLLEVLAEKGAGKVDCPSCGTSVSSHHFYKGRLPRREIVRHSESAAPQMTKAELLKKHPCTALKTSLLSMQTKVAMHFPTKSLNMARVPGVIVEAGDRAENYIQFNNINTQNKVSRSEEDVPLTSIPLTGADVAEALAKYIDKKVSVNRKRVAEVMNVDELVCEVESLLLTLN
jgi:uncharacterized Zn finger protein (UPF0148 family)